MSHLCSSWGSACLRMDTATWTVLCCLPAFGLLYMKPLPCDINNEWCVGVLTSYAVSGQERGFVASSTKGAGAKSSGFTGQSVDKVAAGGASEWEVEG